MRHGGEGSAELQKDSCSFGQEGDFNYYKEIRVEGSKNHQAGSEKLGNNGITSFCQGLL